MLTWCSHEKRYHADSSYCKPWKDGRGLGTRLLYCYGRSDLGLVDKRWLYSLSTSSNRQSFQCRILHSLNLQTSERNNVVNRPALLRCRNVQWDCTIGDHHTTTRAEVLKFSRQTILSVEASVCTSACLRSCSELRNLTAVGVPQLGFCVLPPKCISFQKKPISFHLESSNYRQCLELNPNNPVSIWEKVCMTYFTPPTNLTTCHSHITWLGR